MASAFSPDGKHFASFERGGTVRVWDLSTRKQVGRSFPGIGGAFSPDGALLAITQRNLYPRQHRYDLGVRVWDVVTGRRVGPAFRGYFPTFSRDSRRVAIVAFDDPATVQLRNVRSGELIHESAEPGGLFAVNYDGSTRVPVDMDSDPGKIRVWDVTTGRWVGKAVEHHFCGCVLASNADRLATFDKEGIELWDSSTGESTGQLPADDIQGVALSADGKRMATAHDREVRIWDLSTKGKARLFLHGKPATFSPDGSQLGIRQPKRQRATVEH